MGADTGCACPSCRLGRRLLAREVRDRTIRNNACCVAIGIYLDGDRDGSGSSDQAPTFVRKSLPPSETPLRATVQITQGIAQLVAAD